MNPSSIAIAAIYLIVLVTIGIWAARHTRSPRDFFIAGQRLGLVVAALATLSAAFSGFVFLGGPGLMVRMGIGSMLICVPVGFTAGMLCWVVAKQLRLVAGKREIFTVPDAIHARFDNRTTSGAAALAVLLGSVSYLAAQFLALAVLLRSLVGADSAATSAIVVLGVVIVVAYSMGGGMLAGIYTDVVQGGLMIVAALAVFYYALRAGGGFTAMTASIRSAPEFGSSFLEPLGTAPALTGLGFLFVFGVGTLGQPQMLHKFFMLRDIRSLRWMPWILGAGQSACILIWLGIGLAVPALIARGDLAALVSPDRATPEFLATFAPDLLTGLVVAGVLAAIMSSADSFLNIGSAALVRDLPKLWLGRPLQRELAWGRIATLGIALSAAWLAVRFDDLIALLGTLAFGTFAAALTPTIALGWNWTRATAAGATASILTGIGINLGLEFFARQEWFEQWPRPNLAPGALPSAVALAASFLALIVVSLLTRDRTSEIPEDIRQILDA